MVTTQNPIIIRIDPIINAICDDNIVIWGPIDPKKIVPNIIKTTPTIVRFSFSFIIAPSN